MKLSSATEAASSNYWRMDAASVPSNLKKGVLCCSLLLQLVSDYLGQLIQQQQQSISNLGAYDCFFDSMYMSDWFPDDDDTD